ncbi:MAG: acyl carrier protein [Gammaproteobacteria bacterium]|nr:acyl carrier protein [Gammaproteobacteria bacterium]MBU1623998.1 acyl carrier protein [Gammaproteobacteria bacterium]MBU1981726.1 acyl carrier protein [Gammaproteobacteria bacterium]
MVRAQVLEIIRNNLVEILDNDQLQVGEQTSANEVEDWDSLNHVRLLISLEAVLNIRFEPEETASAGNIGELIDLILTKRQ